MDYRKMSPDEYCNQIIKSIISLMEEKSIRQLDLATRSNISQSSLSKILKGEMRLTLQHIFKICLALDVSPEELISLTPKISNNTFDKSYSNYNDTGLINEQYMNEQILIRDKNHPAFNGYTNNTFYIYLFSTITTESFLLEGRICFDSKNSSFCKADMTLDTGKVNAEGKPTEKHYSGELIISLTMGACYCILTNPEIGEICFLNFRHMFIFNQNLECRVGTISSTSSGGNRLPVVQRILISRKPLHVSGKDQSDLEFVQGQLRLNNSMVLISRNDLDELIEKYKSDQNLSGFFKKFAEISEKKEYNVLDESCLQNIPVSSSVKTKGLSLLRNMSTALRYNKVSTKTDEYVFEYITNTKS